MILKLAWRNLWRNKRRTLLTMSAMSSAAALCILSLGIYEAMFRDMIDGSTGRYIGHGRIMTKEYEQKGKTIDAFDLNFTDNNDGVSNLRALITEIPGVAGASGRIKGNMLLQYGEFEDALAQPAEVIGIDPSEEKSVSTYADDVIEGEFISGKTFGSESNNSHIPGIVLAVGLAKKMKAGCGDEIAAIGQAADGSLAAELFNVIGIIDVKDPARNMTMAFTDRPTLQTALSLENKVHELVVKLDNPADLYLLEGISEEVPKSETAYITDWKLPGNLMMITWQESLPMIAKAMEMWDAMQIVMTIIIFSAVLLVTTNTLLMAFMERKMEYAVIKSLGMPPFTLVKIIISEAFMMSVIAGLTGLGGGIAGMLLMHHIKPDISGFIGQISYGGAIIQPVLSANITPMNTLMPFALLVISASFISLYPAWKTRSMNIAVTLRTRE